MRKFILCLSLLFISLIVNSKNKKIEIQKIEVYAMNFLTPYYFNYYEDDLKKTYGQFVRIIDKTAIDKADLNALILNLETRENKKKDYKQILKEYGIRAIVTMYYANGKKEVYYLSNGGIIKNEKVYKLYYPFVASIYSFFPNSFFTFDYEGSKEYYDNFSQDDE